MGRDALFAMVIVDPTLPVKIVDAVRTTQDERVQWALFWATAVLGLATLLLFVSTAIVARKTADVAVDTLRAAKVADRHHQEGLRPVLTITSASLQFKGFNRVHFDLHGMNIGPGPALNALVIVDSQRGGFALGIGHVGAGQPYDFVRDEIDLDTSGLEAGNRVPFTIELEYWNLFEKRCTSRCSIDRHEGRPTYSPGSTTFAPPEIADRVDSQRPS